MSHDSDINNRVKQPIPLFCIQFMVWVVTLWFMKLLLLRSYGIFATRVYVLTLDMHLLLIGQTILLLIL